MSRDAPVCFRERRRACAFRVTPVSTEGGEAQVTLAAQFVRRSWSRRCKIPAHRRFARPVFLTHHLYPVRLNSSWRKPTPGPATGGVAQLGERVNGIHEVRGSIPLASTPGH